MTCVICLGRYDGELKPRKATAPLGARPMIRPKPGSICSLATQILPENRIRRQEARFASTAKLWPSIGTPGRAQPLRGQPFARRSIP